MVFRWWIECGWVESSKIEMLICVFKRDVTPRKTYSFFFYHLQMVFIFRKYEKKNGMLQKSNDHVQQHLFTICLLPQMYKLNALVKITTATSHFHFHLWLISIAEQKERKKKKSTFYHTSVFSNRLDNTTCFQNFDILNRILNEGNPHQTDNTIKCQFFSFFQMLTTYTLSICLLFHFQIFFFLIFLYLSFSAFEVMFRGTTR